MIIIDTRSEPEYKSGHVEGAINISPEKFMQGLPPELTNIALDEEIILYCRSGARSNTCGQMLARHGFTNVINGVSQGRVEAMLRK